MSCALIAREKQEDPAGTLYTSNAGSAWKSHRAGNQS